MNQPRMAVCRSRRSQLAIRHLFGRLHPVAFYASFLIIGFFLPGAAFALDPSLDVSQYAHTAWKVRDGFTRGGIRNLAQTPDGYLWLGTDFGLYQFDGVRAILWQPPDGQRLPDPSIWALIYSRDGTLWIGTRKGLVSWKDGRLTQYPALAGMPINVLMQDRHGTVWLGISQPGRLCSIQAGNLQCHAEGSLGESVDYLYEDHEGSLWILASTGVWKWNSSSPEHYALLDVRAIIEGENGQLLLACLNGLKQIVGGRVRTYKLPGISEDFSPYRGLFRSSDGSLWVTANQRLLHLHEGRTDIFGVADGLSSDTPVFCFEDREGSVWVQTFNGLDRFREYEIPRVSRDQGLSTNSVYALQATSDGAVWFSTSKGLNKWKNGRVSVNGRQIMQAQIAGTLGGRLQGERTAETLGLGLDDAGRLVASTRDDIFYFDRDQLIRIAAALGPVLSMAGDGLGRLWVNYDTQGLSYLTPGAAAQQFPWSRFGKKGSGARTMLPVRSDNSVWLGFWDGGLIHIRKGEVRASYTAADGLGSGRVNDLRFGSRGTLWAATEGGLSYLRDGRIQTLSSKNGLPCDTVHWSMEDDDHFFWLYLACGLVRIASSEMDAWENDPNRTVQFTTFDAVDGVRTLSAFSGIGPRVTKAADGKIWFATYDGVSVIRTGHRPINTLPPPVRIQNITADDKTFEITNGMHLPTGVRHLDIDYTALSLVVPEKVRFRVKLEGEDKDWRETVNVRHVEYTNLPPKHYKFRVLACNNSGVWNEEGAALDFVIPPAWYQTNWFRGACILAFLGMIWGIHELRVRQLAAQFNMRLEERVAERTRIARDLHDTLLQSFQGLLLQFKAVSYRLQPGEIKKSLDAAIGEASQAITEGRDTVQGLRASMVEKNDLAEAIRASGEELASSANNQPPVAFEVVVEGRRKRKRPFLRDEVYRIAIEALRNAFRHAQADRIEVELQYGDKEFTLRVRDNGRGIDRDILSADGRKGHFGLHGMRERAKLAGGELAIWSEVNSGTELELTIPASRAYTRSARRFWWFRKPSQKDTNVKEKVES